MTATLRRGMSFALGFGFTLVPGWGPFVAVLFALIWGWRVRRVDLAWLAAAVSLALPAVLAGHGLQAASSALQVVAAWAVFHAFRELRGPAERLLTPRLLAAGMLTGLAAVVGSSLAGIEAIHFRTAKTLAEAIIWGAHPALYGHTVLTIGAAIAILVDLPLARILSLALSALGILVSGSREAVIAWVLVAAVLWLGSRHRWWTRLLEAALLVVMALAAVGLSSHFGWGKIGFLVDPATTAHSANLLQGTEIAQGDWWDTSWVDVRTEPVDLGGRTLLAYEVHKRGGEQWLRLQQGVDLTSGTPYTVSAWVRTDAAGVAGLQGWGTRRTDAGNETFFVGGSWQHGRWRATVVGPGTLLDAGVSARQGAWARVYAAFRYDGAADPLPWFVGLAPDQRDGGQAAATFAGFQLERGATPTPYVPAIATEQLDLATARLPLWRVAWEGFLDRPWMGWGADAFPERFRAVFPVAERVQVIPAHAHNVFLQEAFTGGALGLFGVVLLLVALAADAVRRRDGAFLGVLLAVLVANVFDTTLFYAGVLYPLAALGGWRSATPLGRTSPLDDPARQALTRLALAVADFATAALALLAARWVLGAEAAATLAPGAWWYALLLWPAMAFREGLYPGYGLSPPQELRKHVAAAATASVLLAAITLPWRGLRAPGVVEVALLAAFASIGMPVARALTKRILLSLGAWGRPVVVLGAGAIGSRTVVELLARPLSGLYPVAVFDDDPGQEGRDIAGVPVRGALADAGSFAARHGIRHALVAIPSLPAARLRALVDAQGRTFSTVQYLPALPGLPAEDTFATSLGGRLTLEVRNGLVSPANRAAKRVVDLILGGVVAVLLSPLLAALYLWVRLDSRGPGFHRSVRLGEHGRVFGCLKFRTMHDDAEARLQEVLDGDPAAAAQYAVFHKLDRDQRITRAGRILRALSLDELPQVVNVLLGEMSLVGPRPYLVREKDDMGPFADLLLQAKPGMTGHWQVTARNEVTFRDRLQMEAHYVRNWSIWWDIILLTQTPAAVLRRRGAK